MIRYSCQRFVTSHCLIQRQESCEVSGFHGSDHEDYCLFVYDALYFGIQGYS